MIIINGYTFPSVPVETGIGTHTITSVYEKEHEEYTVLEGLVDLSSKVIIHSITPEMETDPTIKIVDTTNGHINGMIVETESETVVKIEDEITGIYTDVDGTVNETTILRIINTLDEDYLTEPASLITKLILKDPDYLTESKIVCNNIPPVINLALQDGINEAKVISGIYPISLFDQYQVHYVNKGSSDKLQTPEVKTIQEVPDGKDVFKVVSDPRASIQIPYTVTTKTNLGKVVTKDFSQTTTQTFNMVKLWIQDYVATRRNL